MSLSQRLLPNDFKIACLFWFLAFLIPIQLCRMFMMLWSSKGAKMLKKSLYLRNAMSKIEASKVWEIYFISELNCIFIVKFVNFNNWKCRLPSSIPYTSHENFYFYSVIGKNFTCMQLIYRLSVKGLRVLICHCSIIISNRYWRKVYPDLFYKFWRLIIFKFWN